MLDGQFKGIIHIRNAVGRVVHIKCIPWSISIAFIFDFHQKKKENIAGKTKIENSEREQKKKENSIKAANPNNHTTQSFIYFVYPIHS